MATRDNASYIDDKAVMICESHLAMRKATAAPCVWNHERKYGESKNHRVLLGDWRLSILNTECCQGYDGLSLSLSLTHTHTHTHAVYNSHQLILSRSLVTFASYWKRLLQWRVLTSKDGCGEGGGYILHCKHFTLSTSGITDGAEGEDSDPNRELTSNKFCRPVGTMSWRCMEERRYGSTHSPRLY
jgi:hypothetical protein